MSSLEHELSEWWDKKEKASPLVVVVDPYTPKDTVQEEQNRSKEYWKQVGDDYHRMWGPRILATVLGLKGCGYREVEQIIEREQIVDAPVGAIGVTIMNLRALASELPDDDKQLRCANRDTSAALSLVLDCQLVNFPITLPPQSTIWSVDLNFPNAPLKLFTGLRTSAFPRDDFSGMGYKCEIINFNTQPVINVAGTFKFSIGEMVPSGSGFRGGPVRETHDCQVNVPLIESNSGWSFYFFSLDSTKYGTLTPPKTVTLELREKTGKLEVPLKQTENMFRTITVTGPFKPSSAN